MSKYTRRDRIEARRRARWAKKLRKAYKWWDFIFMFQMIQDWAEWASERHLKDGISLSSCQKAKDLQIFAEYAKRIAEDSAFTEGTKLQDGSFFLDGKYALKWLDKGDHYELDPHDPVPKGLYNHIRKKEEDLYQFYLNGFIKYLRKSRYWWD